MHPPACPFRSPPQSTATHTALELSRDVELSTGRFGVNVLPDRIAYAAHLPRDNVAHVLGNLIGPMLAAPRLQEWEVEDMQSFTHRRAAEMLSLPDVLLGQEAHRTAFRSQGLGRDLYPDPYAPHLTPQHLRTFLDDIAVGSRITVTGLNVDHDTLSSAAEAGLSSLASTSSVSTAITSPYKGGESRLRAIGPDSTETHVALGLHHDAGLAPGAFLTVLALLGRGHHSVGRFTGCVRGVNCTAPPPPR